MFHKSGTETQRMVNGSDLGTKWLQLQYVVKLPQVFEFHQGGVTKLIR